MFPKTGVIEHSRANLYVSLRRRAALQTGEDWLYVRRAVPGDGRRAAVLGTPGGLASSEGHPQHYTGRAALCNSQITDVMCVFDVFMVYITAYARK